MLHKTANTIQDHASLIDGYDSLLLDGQQHYPV